MRRLTRSLLALTLALPVVVAAADGDPVQPNDCVFNEPEVSWTSVRPQAPAEDDRRLGSGNDAYVGMGMDRLGGGTVAVVDSRVLQASTDGGCTWDEVVSFEGDPTPLEPVESSTARFLDVDVADTGLPDAPMVALVGDLEAFLGGRLRTVVSRDGGTTFDWGGEGLPNLTVQLPRQCDFTRDCGLQIAPSDDEVVMVGLQVDFTSHLYRSEDGGLTFELVSGGLTEVVRVGGESSASPTPEKFAFHPGDDQVLFGASFQDLVSSGDGGRTWYRMPLRDAEGQPVAGVVRDVLAIAAGPGTSPGDEPVVVAVVTNGVGNNHIVVSRDRGLTWALLPQVAPDDITHLVAGDGPGSFVLTAPDGAFRLDVATGDLVDLGGRDFAGLYDPHVVAAVDEIWFRGPRTLPVRGAIPPVRPLPPIPPVEIPGFDPAVPVGPTPGRFLTPELVRLDVGEQQVVPVDLVLPVVPTPLDVMFLVDQSGSMSEEMAGLRKAIVEVVNALTAQGINLHAGLAGHGHADVQYELHANIQDPTTGEFAAALARMQNRGGLTHHWTAFDQIATGRGVQAGRYAGVRPGQQAEWRVGSLRVVLNLTDTYLGEGDEADPARVLRILEREAIRVITMNSDDALAGSPVNTDDPRPSVDSAITEDDLNYGEQATLARRTKAVAGPSGVDCAGDGERDIAPGGPIACYLSRFVYDDDLLRDQGLVGSMADVVAEMLAATVEGHVVTLHTNDPSVVRRFSPPRFDFDITVPNRERVDLTVGCDLQHEGQLLTPLVTAVAGARHLAATPVPIACGDVPREVLAALPPVGVAAAPPPAPAPLPVPAPAPASAAANASASAQAAAQATSPAAAQALTPQFGVAAAAQKQHQAQAATLGPSGAANRGDAAEFAFSALPQRADPGPAVVLAGAVLASAVGAVGLRRQRASRPGRVRA